MRGNRIISLSDARKAVLSLHALSFQEKKEHWPSAAYASSWVDNDSDSGRMISAPTGAGAQKNLSPRKIGTKGHASAVPPAFGETRSPHSHAVTGMTRRGLAGAPGRTRHSRAAGRFQPVTPLPAAVVLRHFPVPRNLTKPVIS